VFKVPENWAPCDVAPIDNPTPAYVEAIEPVTMPLFRPKDTPFEFDRVTADRPLILNVLRGGCVAEPSGEGRAAAKCDSYWEREEEWSD